MKIFLLALLLVACRRETPAPSSAEAKPETPREQRRLVAPSTPAEAELLPSLAAEDIAPSPEPTDVELEAHAARSEGVRLTAAPVFRAASVARVASTSLRPIATEAHTVPLARHAFGPDLFLGEGYWFLEFGPITPTPELFRERAIFVLRGCMLGNRRVPTTLWGQAISRTMQSHGMYMVPVQRDTPRIPVWIYDALGSNGRTDHIVLDPVNGFSTLLWCGIIEPDGSVTTSEVCP